MYFAGGPSTQPVRDVMNENTIGRKLVPVMQENLDLSKIGKILKTENTIKGLRSRGSYEIRL